MSMGQEMISFLIPNFNEPIQLIFFSLMLGGVLLTIFKVKMSAKPDYWEFKWNGGTVNDLSDDLDAEHGSVSDISNAVATSWEKLAEAMPGILLILGLLGTFLGLGIALNKASTILSGASAAGMDDSMANLMGMMEGLGTKFKTSTWGILAFLSLKIWMSYDGFDEKRLRWCIRKVKGELDGKRLEVRQLQQNEHQQFISSIDQLGERLCISLQAELSENREVLQQNQALLTKKVELSTQNKAGITAVTNLLRLQLDKNETLISHSLATRESLTTFVQANTSNLEAMQKSSSQMADAATGVGESAGDLKIAISSFKEGVADVLDSLKKDLNITMAQMSQQNTESAADLKATIGNFQSGVSEVMATMKSDLSESITEMNDSFGKNMSKMSADLGAATTGIADAISLLSTSVGKTMTSVEGAIGKSLEIQKSAQVEFLTTSENLNVNVASMTGLVNKLQEDIKSGLKAVSESNRNVASLNDRYKNVTESVADLSKDIQAAINGHAEQLKNANSSYLLQLKSMNGKDEAKESFNALLLTQLRNIDTNLQSAINTRDGRKEMSESRV